MKKHVTVKQIQLDTNQKNILYKDYLELSQQADQVSMKYIEDDRVTVVELTADGQRLQLKRSGEMVTELCFCENERTKGTIQSAYGTIQVSVFTHKYIQKDNIIAVEYDVLVDDEVTGRFRLLCTMKEVMA